MHKRKEKYWTSKMRNHLNKLSVQCALHCAVDVEFFSRFATILLQFSPIYQSYAMEFKSEWRFEYIKGKWKKRHWIQFLNARIAINKKQLLVISELWMRREKTSSIYSTIITLMNKENKSSETSNEWVKQQNIHNIQQAASQSSLAKSQFQWIVSNEKFISFIIFVFNNLNGKCISWIW